MDQTLKLFQHSGQDLNCSKTVDLFLSAKFFNLHKESFSQSFLLYGAYGETKEVQCLISFCETSPGNFSSPLRGPYGGLWSKVDLPIKDKFDFLNATIGFLKDKHAKMIQIVMPPSEYFPTRTSHQLNCFHRLGFSVFKDELNCSIDVTAEDYLERIDHGNRKRIRKAIENGFEFQIAKLEELPEIYNVIASNRERKGVPITMSLSALEKMSQLFPDKMRLFKVVGQNRICAASISLLVNDQILYVFYWGDADSLESMSPVSLLSKGIYQFCQNQKIKLMDLGVSTLNGVPNHGLLRFKENLGASTHSKLGLQWNLG